MAPVRLNARDHDDVASYLGALMQDRLGAPHADLVVLPAGYQPLARGVDIDGEDWRPGCMA